MLSFAVLGRRSVLLVAIVLLVVGANSWVAVRAIRRQIESQRRVATSHDDIYQLERLLSLMKDAETGNRGYIITGEERYLEPWLSAVSQLQEQMPKVQRLALEDPKLQPYWPELQASVKRRLDVAQQGIDLRRQDSFLAARQFILSDIGKQEMDHIRRVVDFMQGIERKRLSGETEQVRQNVARTFWTFALATLANLVLIVIAYRLYTNEQSARLRAQQTALNLEKFQAMSDAALSQLSAEKLLQEMLYRVKDILACDTAMAMLLEKDGELHVRAAVGLEKEKQAFPSVPIGRGFDGKVAATRRPLILDDISKAEVISPVLQKYIRSVAGVPMIVEGRLTGVLHVGRRQESGFAPEDVGILQTAADRIAVATDRAQLFDAEQQARHEVELKAKEIQKINAELEKRVHQRTIELENANKELEAFSYSVSHDLRAPLRTLDGFSQAVLEDYGDKLDAAGKDYLDRIRAASQRMGELIDALLQLSRVSRADLEMQPVDISAIAREVAAELQLGKNGRTIHFSIADDIRAWGDARLLRVVLENLMGNAWKFTSANADAAIEVGRQDGATFFVRDNGAGFDMQYAHKLFGAFQRLHGDSQFKGSGIGLATVQRIVRRHGGRIWAEGAVNGGATFYVRLGDR